MSDNSGKIYALHEKNFEDFLKEIGQLEKFKDGRLKCHKCHKKINSAQEIGYFFKTGDQIQFVCDSSVCLLDEKL